MLCLSSTSPSASQKLTSEFRGPRTTPYSTFAAASIQKFNSNLIRKIYGLDKIQLHRLTWNLISLFYHYQGEQIALETISLVLNKSKKNFYNLVNFLCSIKLFRKINKSCFQWDSEKKCLAFLRDLPALSQSRAPTN